jgi:hypothetical protein
MPRIAFTFSYQAFTRYVRDNCDSEQEVDGSRVDERWLYANMDEYLRARAGHLYEFTWEKFTPTEFRTGRAGGPKRIDLVACSHRNPEDGALAWVLEAKLMVDDNRQWGQEIITDILRVACVKDRTNRRTQRYVMVVGQERCWRRAVDQCGGVLGQLLPLEPSRDPRTLWLTRKRKCTTFSESWRKERASIVEDYLIPLLPAGVEIELTGCSLSQRGPDEQPEAGITARLWRVYPR